MTDPNIKYSRLFINAPLKRNAQISLEKDHAHYLKNVMRKSVGDVIRLFNGRDGEWKGEIESIGKKSCDVRLIEQLRMQSEKTRKVALYFSPIKKQRMQILIEKSVELGVTDLHPVLMNHSDNTKVNLERLYAQVIEAVEQCERLDVPNISPPKKLDDFIRDIDGPTYVCLERSEDALSISRVNVSGDVAFLIGPEGGFSQHEREMILNHNALKPISLGENILRAETAAISCLSYTYLSTFGVE